MLSELDHIGLAVRDLNAAVATYERLLGMDVEGREEIPERKIEIAFFKLGGVKLELISPTSEESVVHGFLVKNGEGLHHLAFKTADIEAAAEALTTSSFRIAQGPAEGAHGARVLFLHPKDSHGVLVELVQKG